MIFIPLLIAAIILYLSGQRVWATVIFSFFLLDGFQLVPEAFFGTKPKDFALVYVLVLFAWGCVRYDDFIPKNKLTLFIGIYLLFVFLIIFCSKFHYHIAWSEIIRTSRHYFFVLAYFVLRRMEQKEVRTVIHVLFCVLLLQCVLFIIQVFTGVYVLTGHEFNFYNGWVYRSYNIPQLIYYLMFYALFANPFRGMMRIVTAVIPTLAVFLSLHRSWIMSAVLVVILGILLWNDLLKSRKNLLKVLAVAIPVALIAGTYVTGRTITDLNSVAQGDFMDIEDTQLDEESTLLFRAAHFYERMLYVAETRIGLLFGAGLMTEDSDYTYNTFDFIIGLDDPASGEVIQLDTSDTAWSNFIIRYGLLGTLAYLALYGFLLFFFLRNWRKEIYVLPIFLGMLFIFCISITSDGLYYTSMLMIPLLIFDLVKDEETNSTDLSI